MISLIAVSKDKNDGGTKFSFAYGNVTLDMCGILGSEFAPCVCALVAAALPLDSDFLVPNKTNFWTLLVN